MGNLVSISILTVVFFAIVVQQCDQTRRRGSVGLSWLISSEKKKSQPLILCHVSGVTQFLYDSLGFWWKTTGTLLCLCLFECSASHVCLDIMTKGNKTLEFALQVHCINLETFWVKWEILSLYFWFFWFVPLGKKAVGTWWFRPPVPVRTSQDSKRQRRDSGGQWGKAKDTQK